MASLQCVFGYVETTLLDKERPCCTQNTCNDFFPSESLHYSVCSNLHASSKLMNRRMLLHKLCKYTGALQCDSACEFSTLTSHLIPCRTCWRSVAYFLYCRYMVPFHCENDEHDVSNLKKREYFLHKPCKYIGALLCGCACEFSTLTGQSYPLPHTLQVYGLSFVRF